MTGPHLSNGDTPTHPLPSGLIHELRTPLNAIIGYSELLIEQTEENGQDGLGPALQKILIAGRQLHALINTNFHPVRALDSFVDPSAPRNIATTPIESKKTEALPELAPAGEPMARPIYGFLLVVDDIEANRDVLSGRLKGQGYAVATAENGRQALDMLRAYNFDLVLLDIMMPEMNGYEMLQRLKADEALRHIPVIMISALSELDSAVRCIEMGAEDYLLKPFNPTLLKARIGACLGKKLAAQTERALESAKQHLETSRQAGMAEVATSILHNVGNVLNSVNVSGGLILDKVQKSKVTGLARAVALLDSNKNNLSGFFENDPKGRLLLGYLAKLVVNLAHEQKEIILEVHNLLSNILHIKEIVAMQQDYARVSGMIETLNIEDLVEDALRLTSRALDRHAIKLIRQYGERRVVLLDKHKVLQILVNLIRNAKHSFDDSPAMEKQIILRITNVEDRVEISVIDNGIGIPAENLKYIFNHGFTTKKDGHGFGLHSGAITAKELGGTLRAYSEGTGRGSRFTLELPLGEAVR